jgi:hypothetical protein
MVPIVPKRRIETPAIIRARPMSRASIPGASKASSRDCPRARTPSTARTAREREASPGTDAARRGLELGCCKALSGFLRPSLRPMPTFPKPAEKRYGGVRIRWHARPAGTVPGQVPFWTTGGRAG